MTVTDERLSAIDRTLRLALGLEVFVEIGFIVAILAYNGAFNGGQPTTTPPAAIAYTVISLFVTIAVIGRSVSMVMMARRGDIAGLRRVHVQLWVGIALVFSAILPSIYLQVAATQIRDL